ncbi:MAG: NAD-dependent epimerase/dehydratase family protein [Alphaproteobacteria bacterium]|jgi:nucleoside-diphosphate-sugar epimerase|nr:NAD-dependent epimerase/dehydratase family protein [Alphaproteobacteria bacterium]
MRVAVIGANGFVGRHACLALRDAGHVVTGVIRQRGITEIEGAATIAYMDHAGPETDWEPLIAEVDAILHLVSPSGATGANEARILGEIRDGALALARAAASKGIKRFVFVSSIKVNGEVTTVEPFRTSSTPQPDSIYGAVKLETENGLTELSEELGMAVTIVRPSAVYGPGGFGNIHLLAKLLSRVPGWIVPLGGIENRRALIHVGNLASALVQCIDDEGDANRLFLLHDGAAVSTSTLCELILLGLGKPTRLLSDRIGVIRGFASILAPGLTRRLYGSLDIDDDGISRTFGWTPPVTTAEGIRQSLASNGDER